MADGNLLLFEGKDEWFVFRSLMTHHGIDVKVAESKSFDGIADLLEKLPVQLRSDEVKRLGIVVDADTDISSRWQAIRNILIAGDYTNAPKSPSPEGTIVELENLSLVRVPKVGVWIMPDNKLPGMLENFVSFLGAATDPLWDIADECLKHIPEEHRRFKESQRIKAHLHTWLAWQKKPGTPLGQSITAKFLDADAPHAQQLIGWIRRLFDL